MRSLILILALLAQGVAVAQTSGSGQARPFSYNYAELRFVDADDGGDGFELRGSFSLDQNWVLLGGIRSLDFENDVDWQIIDIGAAYVWHYRPNLDLIGAVKYLNGEVDSPFGSDDDSGLGLTFGLRSWLSSDFEWRAAVHHQSFDDSDTYLELAGDYYLNNQFSIGLSLEFAGDLDAFTLGGRWFFR